MKWKFVDPKGVRNMFIFLLIGSFFMLLLMNVLPYFDKESKYLIGTSFFDSSKVLSSLGTAMMFTMFFLESSLFFPIDMFMIKNESYIFRHHHLIVLIKVLFFISIFVLIGFAVFLSPEAPEYELRRTNNPIAFNVIIVASILFFSWVIIKYVYNKILNWNDYFSISKDEMKWYDDEIGERSVSRLEINSIILKEDKIGLRIISISLNKDADKTINIELKNLRLEPHQIKIKSVIKKFYSDLLQEL